jgi:predicted nucleic acid-binding protein
MGIVALAIETCLTAYDASYVQLARQLGVRLVTLDEQLPRACESR